MTDLTSSYQQDLLLTVHSTDAAASLHDRTGWVIPVTCTCGSTHLEHLTGSEPDAIGARVTAIARCTDCHREWQIVAILTPVGERGRGKAA